MNSPIEVFTGATELSAQEEVALASSIAAGDTAALHKLVESNIGLVVTIAQKFAGKGLTVDDLIGEGTLGLTRAARMFKPGNGSRFCTYASYWITQTITQALFESHLIQIPGHMRPALKRWKAAQRELTETLGLAATAAEVAASLGLSRRKSETSAPP